MPPSERSEPDFGARLRRARETRCVSLRQIAETTKLSVAAMEALERNDISRLPGGIFSRAFVRSYASEIGLDPEAAVREFMTSFPHESVTAGSPEMALVLEHAPDLRRRAGVAIVVVVAIVIMVAAALYFVIPR